MVRDCGADCVCNFLGGHCGVAKGFLLKNQKEARRGFRSLQRRFQKSGNKADAQRAYFDRRLKQRYGIVSSDKLVALIISKIRNELATLIEHQSIRVSVWEVEINGTKIRVVFDKTRNQIVTALPKEHYECPNSI